MLASNLNILAFLQKWGGNMDPIKLSYNLDISDKSSWLTVTTAPSVRTSFAYVQELGDFYCGPSYFTTRENLPSYLIKLTLSGEGTLEYDNATYQVSPGKLFWVDCRKPQHYFASSNASKWHTLWVHLYGPTTQSYYEAFLDQNAGSAIISSDLDSAYLDIFKRLLGIYKSESASMVDDIQASGLLTQLMVNCITTSGQKKSVRQTPDYVASIQAYIDTNYQEDITLDRLAQSFSINKFYLQKLFKRHIGLSPNEYLARTRLAKAKQLLRTTNDSMIRIAEEVGYTATYFDSIFKKYEGVTPRGYRQRWYDPDNTTK